MNNKIGIFDSGIGGTTILNELRNLLPSESFIYYADSKNNPYGEKSDEELFKIVSDVVNILLSKNVKLIVIACNTATTRCIKLLREKYPYMIFVGTEPAIKVACDNDYKNTLVMATPGTINSERTHELVIKNQKKDQNITLLPCDGLANAIENNNNDLIDKLLKKLLSQYFDKNIDSIVLGCTHYPLIKDKIQSLFPNAVLIDGNRGVSNQVKFKLEENNLLNLTKIIGSVEFIYNK